MRTFGPFAVVVLCFIVTACANESGDRTDVSYGSGKNDDMTAPPPIVVSSDETTLELEPYTYCWDVGCSDGAPPENPPEMESAEMLVVEFPEPSWTFEASFQRAGDPCSRTQVAKLPPAGENTHELTPQGPADTYVVDIFGKGENGDAFVQFLWTTDIDGPSAQPHAFLGLLADNDGTVDSYGFEMATTNLAETPKDAAGTVTVSAANGNELTFAVKAKPVPGEGCDAEEGSLSWSAPDRWGKEAAALGGPPFTYTVVLTLDGAEYVAEAIWPDDLIVGQEPYVLLTFDPPLPAL